MSPLFSVVVTTHNRPRLLERALRSLYFQTCKDVQVILCADESSRETKAAAAKYLRERDILLVIPHKRGPAETRNAGLAHATGRYICFLDDDDTFDVDFLSNAEKATSHGSVGLLYFNYRRVLELRTNSAYSTFSSYIEASGGSDETCAKTVSVMDNPLRQCSPDEIMIRNFIPSNSFVVESDVARKEAFDVHLRSHEDWDYLISLSMIVEFRHMDMYGPRVHLAAGDHASRNSAPLAQGSLPIDYLSIYRKWPGIDDKMRSARRSVLEKMGMSISGDLL